MPLTDYICPDKAVIPVKDCLSHCRMGERCLTLPTLALIAQEREWSGVASTTQLLNGTMLEFLKLTKPYKIDPDSRMFMLSGTSYHKNLEEVAKKLGLPSEVPLSIDRDIFDLLDKEDDKIILTDYKLWGSFKVAKALGIKEIGKKPDPSGECYKSSGKWGKAGSPKMVAEFAQVPEEADNWEAELQLNRYRVMLKELTGIQVERMQLQVTVRDGGTYIAHGRGVLRNSFRIPVKFLDDTGVKDYFIFKDTRLKEALAKGEWSEPCNPTESWDGMRCKSFCDVWEYCSKGILIHQINKEE